MNATLEFPKRPKIVATDVGRRRIWESRCHRYRVAQSVFSCAVLRPVWYAMVVDTTTTPGRITWTFAGPIHRTYRTKAAAIAAAEAHAKEHADGR